ncbi:MAG: hypothetical protein ACRBN8_10040 [Nannocystales bacterium]
MRRGALWGCVLLGCSFETTSVGADSATDSALGEVTSSSTTDLTTGTAVGTQGGTGTSGLTTGTVSTGETPGSETEPETGRTTTGSSSSTSEGAASSSGDRAGALSDEGLVARYYLDEAESGTVPKAAFDSAEEPFPLALEYVENTMHYASAFGHRGLAFDVAGADDGARAPISGSKFDGLEGATELTFEVVVRLDDAVGSDSRLVHFGRPNSGAATLSSEDPNQLQFVWNNTIVREWDYTPFSDGVAHVLHVIVDTNAGSDASRFRLLVDGNELPPTILSAVDPGEPASVPNDAFFALGNRDQARAMQGILFYVAIYGVAISDTMVASHVPVLIADDDSP